MEHDLNWRRANSERSLADRGTRRFSLLVLRRRSGILQAIRRRDAFAEFATSDAWYQSEIIGPLLTNESVVVPCTVEIRDAKGNHLTTGKVFWQIKDWAKVKTKA